MRSRCENEEGLKMRCDSITSDRFGASLVQKKQVAVSYDDKSLVGESVLRSGSCVFKHVAEIKIAMADMHVILAVHDDG